MIQISDWGLDQIEKKAEKDGNAVMLLLVLLIREVRGLYRLLDKSDEAGTHER